MRKTLYIILIFISQQVAAQKFEGLALTPPMGWNSWNKFGENINEETIREIADAMVLSGMKDAGYEYIVIDDHWQISRDSVGNIIANPEKFPSGIKALADYVHSKGLKFGLYSDAGTQTCGGKPGSRGYEFQDARMYAKWGVDYLKYDWCNTTDQNAKASYRLMSEALKQAGHPIVFSLCEWGKSNPWEWASEVGHLWRTGTDIIDAWDGIGSWGGGSGVIGIIDKQVGLEKYAGPGHWNDPDMLEVGNEGLTETESKTHFTMWCMLAAPLMAGNDLRNMSESAIKILTNKDLIALDQDPLGKQGTRLSRAGNLETWVKELSGDNWAVCFFNRGEKDLNLSLSWNSLRLLIPLSGDYEIMDLWTKKLLGSLDSKFSGNIPAHGVTVVRFKKKFSEVINPNLQSTNINFSSGNETARKFGVHEIVLKSEKIGGNPFEIDCSFTYTAPSGTEQTVNAFYDGGNTWRARVYVNETGDWKWKSSCKMIHELNRKNGFFKAIDSNLRGMLRPHPENPKSWITDNGQWFLNISDTGYLLFNKHEKLWKGYIEDLSKLGVTSVRAGSLGGETWDKNSEINRFLLEAYPDCPELTMDNFPWNENDYSKMNLERFQTTDDRLIWMLNNYPEMYVQFILFGLSTWGEDDSGEKWKSIPQNIRENTMKYMIARWSAFPQLFYLIVNDMHCSEKFPNNQEYVREVGRYFTTNDPWHHLISTGPNRSQEFPFTNGEDLKWVSYIHIEDIMALDAEKIKLYESYPLHVFNGEDWYEHTRLDRCDNYLYLPDYFYRWMFWSWTLSGGSANYGGRWARIQPYFSTDTLLYVEPLGGMKKPVIQPDSVWAEMGTSSKFEHAKFNTQLTGLNSVNYIYEFFSSRQIDLSGFTPDSEFVTDMNTRKEKDHQKLIRKEFEEFIVYDPNALSAGNNTLIDKEKTVSLLMDFGSSSKTYRVDWYCPSDGKTVDGGKVEGAGKVEFISPWKGVDVVLHLKEDC